MLKRRSACERCRGQKLKCIRELESETGSCMRCSQAQEKCIVNMRKTPGRPSGRGNASCKRTPPANNTPTQTPTPAPTLVLDDSDSISATGNSSLTSSSKDNIESLFDMNIDWGNMDMFPSTGPLGGDGNDQVLEVPSSLFSYAESTGVEPLLPCASWSDTRDFAAPIGMFSCQIRNEICDPGMQLAGLQQNLSKHLVQLQSSSWDITSVLKLESVSYSFQSPKTSCEASRSFNPLIGTFDIITEFEHVLATLRNNIECRERLEISSLRRQMNTSYMLTAISCYLQLVCIYHIILSYVLDQASNNPVVRNFILDSTPGISLSGFEIPTPKNVLGRSFAQLIQHKIRPIETGLGLPDNCRISKDSNMHQSSERTLLLGAVEGQVLLKVLHGQSTEEESPSSTMGLVESLRAKIIEIENLGG